MGHRSLTHRVDHRIAHLAGRQHGVVARWQLLELGVGVDQITIRARSERLHQIHRGVYLVGHPVRTEHARDMAALLAFRNEAVLSHRSAANLWGVLAHPATAAPCVTVPPARSATRPGIEAHRASLDRRDVRRRYGMALTSPPRTVLDLAGELGGRRRAGQGQRGRVLSELEAIVAAAQYRRLASEGELLDQIDRNPRKRGVVKLRQVLDLPGGPRRTRSPAERRMLALLRGAAIEGYEVNERIHGYEVDFLWRVLGLVVEVDGYDGHSGRVAFERDRVKWAELTARGLRVMPITGRQIRDDPAGVIERLRLAGVSLSERLMVV